MVRLPANVMYAPKDFVKTLLTSPWRTAAFHVQVSHLCYFSSTIEQRRRHSYNANEIKTRIMTIFSLGVNALKFWMEFRCLVGFSFHDSMIIQEVQPLRHAINSSSILRGRSTTAIYSNAVFLRLTPRKCLSLIGSWFNCPSMFWSVKIIISTVHNHTVYNIQSYA